MKSVKVVLKAGAFLGLLGFFTSALDPLISLGIEFAFFISVNFLLIKVSFVCDIGQWLKISFSYLGFTLLISLVFAGLIFVSSIG